MRKTRLVTFLIAFVLLFPASGLSELDEDELDITEVVEEQDDESNTGIIDTDGSTTITVSCTGDFTIGGDNYHHKEKDFYGELKSHDNDINFTMANVRGIFAQDDLTIVNFEGTFTETKYVPANKKENQFLFNIAPSYVTVLTDNSIEAVSLENNHVMDHGEEGYEETKQTLENAGVVYSNSEIVGVFNVKGYQIAMLSYLCIDRYDKPVGGFDNLYDKVAHDIAESKKTYPIVIVSFHWGREKDYTPTSNQIKMGRLAVDSGADLVIGHHSHRINPIECYKGVYICYSLGNFCFAGHKAPKDMNSYIFQTRFRISAEGEVTNTGFRIIPIRITSLKDRNNYTPTPITDEMKMEGIVTMLKDNGKKLEYAVPDYPFEWQQ